MKRIYDVPRISTFHESEIANSLGPVTLSAIDVTPDSAPPYIVHHGPAVAGVGGEHSLHDPIGETVKPPSRRGQP